MSSNEEAGSCLQAWVSWAQFEKRVKKDHQDRFQSCRQVLQQGLTLNRTSAALIQVLHADLQLKLNCLFCNLLLLQMAEHS